jgi:RNA polymerase sigma factor (sigma-70 family)
MSDSEIVASIVAGEPEGLAAAYDKYAGDLYGYCQSLLHGPDDAADAVQDTFVIAASKLASLRDPERLRAWLFSVARNECLHRLKSRRASSSLQDAPEPADDSVDVSGEAERAETVALVRAAVGGLNDGERDVINQLWHGLEVAEVAAVLGVSRNYAYTLFSRARDQLEASVGVLLVGRAGRSDCATLDSLLRDWDGRLTALLRKRVGRHIDRCPVCSDRRRRELTPALLYGVSPAAVLSLAALRGSALTAVSRFGGPLSGVRDSLLRLTAAPGSADAVRRSATTFRGNGFPKPAHHGGIGALRPPPHLPLAAGGTAVAAAAATAVFVSIPHPRPAPGPPGGPAAISAPAPGAVQPASAVPASGGPPLRRGAPASTARRGSSGAPVATASASLTTASPTASGAPTAVPASGTPTVVPASGTPTTAAGTLAVSPTTVLLSPLLGGSLTLTASGGPVSWSISEPVSLLGELTVSPMAGSLSAGGNVTVTISVTGLASLDTRLTVSPGGQVVTVVLGLG